MKVNFDILAAAALLLMVGTANAQQAVYTFESPVFEEVSGTYSLDQRISGSLTLSEYVAPNTTADVTPILLGYSFTDGTVTLDETNSEIIFSGITLTTDETGSIQTYGMTFWESPLPTATDEIFTGMDIFFFPGEGTPGCDPETAPMCRPAFVQINSGDLSCNDVFEGVCNSATPTADGNWGAFFRVAAESGFDPDFADQTWTGSPPLQPALSVPAMGPGSILMLMLLLAGLGTWSLRLRSA